MDYVFNFIVYIGVELTWQVFKMSFVLGRKSIIEY